jgi:SET domain-containing protein
MIKPYLYVKKSVKKGRGVFTKSSIPSRTVIEISPVIVLSRSDTNIVDKTRLHTYIFLWGSRLTRTCVALGYCSVYNHSFQPNCEYEMDFDADTMTIKTRRDIRRGEELFINYNGENDDQTPVWFQVKHA